jgi:hypothetical protein
MDSQSTSSARSPSPVPRRLGDTVFRYEGLDPEKNYIRLLRILPGQPQHLLECEILHAPLGDQQRYSAISYAWGDAEDT